MIREFVFPKPLGGSVAEHEKSLTRYFVGRTTLIKPLLQLRSNLVIHLGPKGAGKSAIQKVIEEEGDDCEIRIVCLRPKDIQLWAIAQSFDISLLSEDLNANWVIKVLWEYLLCVEVYRHEFGEFRQLWDKLCDHFRGDAKAVKRLLKRGFDRKGEESISDVFQDLVEELKLEVGYAGATAAATAKIRERAVGEQSENALKRGTILHDLNIAKKAVGTLLHHDYLVLLDDLDEDWSDTPAHRQLLESLIGALHSLAARPKLHFVAALREDIWRSLKLEARDKIRDDMIEVGWTDDRLREMLEKRLSWALNRQSEGLIAQVFEGGSWKRMARVADGNPRRLIQVAEHALYIANGRRETIASIGSVEQAVRDRSGEFLKDLDQLYEHQYPGLELISHVFHGGHAEMKFEDFQLACLGMKERHNPKSREWIVELEDNPEALARLLLDCGLIQYKKSRTADPTKFSAATDDFDDACYLAVHPAYRPAIGLD